MTYRFVSDTSLRIAQIVLLIEAIVRGLNYMLTPSGTAPTYNELELSAPLWVWGSIFVSLGVVGFFGEALLSGVPEQPEIMSTWRAWPSFLAHSGLMILFIAMSLSAIVGVTSRDPFYGFVTPYDMLAFAVGHWVFARRRKSAR